MSPGDYHDDWVARNAVFDLQFNRRWSQTFIPGAQGSLARALKAKGLSQSDIDAQLAAWTPSQAANANWLNATPVASTWDQTVRDVAPWIRDWYSHPTYVTYWETIDVEKNCGHGIGQIGTICSVRRTSTCRSCPV